MAGGSWSGRLRRAGRGGAAGEDGREGSTRRAAPPLAPFEAARRLAGRPGRVCLLSGSSADATGRWSFVTSDPVEVLRVEAGAAGEALARLARMCRLAEREARERGSEEEGDAGGPWPRVVAVLGFDLARAIEPRLESVVAPGAEPALWAGRYRAILRHDALTGRCEILADDEEAASELMARLLLPGPPPAPPGLGPLRADAPGARHAAAVARALELIRAGDIVQVNLARRHTAPVVREGDALALLESLPPVPFAGLVETGEATLVSASPELFLRVTATPGGRVVESRPIKGTLPASADAGTLAASEKDQAEHLMIVDLVRNDLGRVAELGSVKVGGYARTVSFPTVHHLVSTVSARIGPAVDEEALLRATFPGGSVTGAPKVRAVEILSALEPTPRGWYTGAFGWFGAGGTMDLAMTIRTAILGRERLTLHVGGGIVADSEPERELAETEDKAAAWRMALARLGHSGG